MVSVAEMCDWFSVCQWKRDVHRPRQVQPVQMKIWRIANRKWHSDANKWVNERTVFHLKFINADHILFCSFKKILSASNRNHWPLHSMSNIRVHRERILVRWGLIYRNIHQRVHRPIIPIRQFKSNSLVEHDENWWRKSVESMRMSIKMTLHIS